MRNIWKGLWEIIKNRLENQSKCRILTADDFLYIYDKFGADAAKSTLKRVQEGKVTIGALERYMCKGMCV